VSGTPKSHKRPKIPKLIRVVASNEGSTPLRRVAPWRCRKQTLNFEANRKLKGSVPIDCGNCETTHYWTYRISDAPVRTGRTRSAQLSIFFGPLVGALPNHAAIVIPQCRKIRLVAGPFITFIPLSKFRTLLLQELDYYCVVTWYRSCGAWRADC